MSWTCPVGPAGARQARARRCRAALGRRRRDEISPHLPLLAPPHTPGRQLGRPPADSKRALERTLSSLSPSPSPSLSYELHFVPPPRPLAHAPHRSLDLPLGALAGELSQALSPGRPAASGLDAAFVARAVNAPCFASFRGGGAAAERIGGGWCALPGGIAFSACGAGSALEVRRHRFT